MSVDVDRAVEEVFAHKFGPVIYAAIANLPKDRFSTTELTAVSGVGQANVSRELKVLRNVGLVEMHKQNDYSRIENPFWEAMAGLAAGWGL